MAAQASSRKKKRRQGGKGRPFTWRDDPRRYEWPQGVSGNPGGLTKEAKAAIDLAREIAARSSPKAMQVLQEAADGVATMTQKAAAESILGYGLGKPAQAVTLAGDPDNPVKVSHDLARKILGDPEVQKSLDEAATRVDSLAGKPGGVRKPSE